MNELAKILRETAAKLNSEADKLDPIVPVSAGMKFDALTFTGIPKTVDQISALSRSGRPEWVQASEAVMLREYALKDGKEWDAYLKGEVKWPAVLGEGGPGKMPWE